MSDWKDIAEAIYYVAATIAVLAAAWTYRRNSRLEQAQWASTFYEKFYESDRFKRVRNLLDCPTNLSEVDKLVEQEDFEFTDYLNFFEHVAILTESKRLNRKDVEDSFGYYLNCLENLEKVREYINNEEKGYEQLRDFLRTRRPKGYG